MIRGFSVKTNIGLVGAINYNDNNYDLDSAKKNIKWYNILFIHRSYSFFNKALGLYLFKNEEQINAKSQTGFIPVEIVSGASLLFKTNILKEIKLF